MWALSHLVTLDTLGTLAVPIVSLFYLFAGTGIAAYDFLCPNLHLLSLHTGLSEAVIGATFIAFGNASGDIFSAFVALHSGNSSLAVGSIIGAAFYIICVVVGALAIIQPSTVIPNVFLRDTCFLVVAVTLILFVVADGKIAVHESIGLILLYIMYAVMVIKSESQERVEPEFSHSNYMHLHPELDDAPIRPSFYGAVEHFADSETEHHHHHHHHDENNEHPEGTGVGSHISPSVSPKSVPQSESPSSPSLGSLPPSPQDRYAPKLKLPRLNLPDADEEQQVPSPIYKRSPALSICSGISEEEPTTLKEHLLPGYLDWDEKSWFQKFLTIVMWPMLLALQLSIPIPQTKEGHCSPTLISIYTVTAPLAIFGFLLPHTWQYALATLVTIAALFTASRNFEVSVLLPAFCGFVIAVIWILNLASEMVDIVKFIGGILNISKAVLGLTVVAIGNSLGDLVSNISIARSDHATMALSACFGSPLLLILIGLGGSSLVAMAMSGKPYIKIEHSPSVVLTCISLLVILLSLTIILPLNNWKMSRGIGVLCISVWVINVAVNLIIYF